MTQPPPETSPAAPPAPAPSPRILTVHYHRIDGNYDEVGVWTWDWEGARNPQHQEIFPESFDSYGALFRVDLANYGDGARELNLGLLPRVARSWERKDTPERRWLPEYGLEVWMMQGEADLYTRQPDTSPRARAVFLDGPATVVAWFSEHASRATGIMGPEGVRLVSEDGEVILLKQLVHAHDYGATFEFERPVPFEGKRWELQVPNFRAGVLKPRGVLFDGTRFGSREPMGAIVTPRHTDFRVFAPGARSVSVNIYDTHRGPSPTKREEALGENGRGVWTGRVTGDLTGKYYTYLITYPFLERPYEVADVCATNTTGHGTRPRLTDLRATDPPGFRPVRRPMFSGLLADAVITEVHVRDFSISPSSGARHPGKYLAFTEQDTHVPGHPDTKTMLAHLKELGVTHVQLLPVQDFDNHEERTDYNWGYMTTNFNSPDGWYASVLESDARVRELKQLVQAIHDAGMRVIMDVVYNHTADNAQFEQTLPGYYLRLRSDGTRWNGSGCGNEFRSESPMGRRFIINSLRYWVEEYGIDGFRFDLLGLIDRDTVMILHDELKSIHPTVLLYGEPWAAGPCALHHVTDKWALRGTGVGAFNDHFRNALKGEPDGGGTGFVQGAWTRDALAKGIEGSITDWALHPNDSVNYGDCHDNLVLWDKLAFSAPNESEAERVKMHNMTTAILAVSQGAMFLHGGHEFCRSKKGHHNSYNAPDEINQIDWTRKLKYRHVFDFTRAMIALRLAHPVFRLPSVGAVRERLHFYHPPGKSPQTVAFTLDGRELDGETWETAIVLVNPYNRPRIFPLPEGDWEVFAYGMKAATEAFSSTRGRINVPGRSVAIVARTLPEGERTPSGSSRAGNG